MPPNKHGGARPKTSDKDRRGGARRGAGAPEKPYITRGGEIAVKISFATRTAIELISLRRGIGPRELVARLVEEARQKELKEEIL